MQNLISRVASEFRAGRSRRQPSNLQRNTVLNGGSIESTETVVAFRFDGEPLPKPRPHVARRGGIVTSPTYAAYEEELKWAYRAGFAGTPAFIVPVRVLVRFWRSSKTRVDGDNLLKGVLDAGNGIAWVDDCLVVYVAYRLDTDGRRPGLEITIGEDRGQWP